MAYEKRKTTKGVIRMVKRKKKTLSQDLLGLGGASMTIGMGSMMMGVPALNAPAGLKASFGTAASLMPIMTVGVMGKHILGGIEGITKKNKIRRWY